VLTSSQPFTSALVMSNVKMFKYEWVWEKDNSTGFANCKKQPLRKHENILVFYLKPPTYNPQFGEGKPYNIKESNRRKGSETLSGNKEKGLSRANIVSFVRTESVNTGTRYPFDILKIKRDKDKLHPTQKPVALFEYLLKTYTNEGDLVLDNTIGSGTTAVACINTGRNFIGIEMDKGYFDIAKKRIAEARQMKSKTEK